MQNFQSLLQSTLTFQLGVNLIADLEKNGFLKIPWN